MTHRQIVFFPYLSMNGIDEIDLGYLKVWNFEKKKDEYLKDPALKTKIEKIFATQITHHGNVRGIGVVQFPDNDFQPLSLEQSELIQQARATLFLSFVSENNTRIPNANSGHSMATSENFDVIYQNFTLDQDYVAETSGEIIRFSKGGYTLDKVRFQIPSFVPTPSSYRYDQEVFTELAYLKSHKPTIYRKIVNSTQIFMEGYYNSNHLSNKARILLFMSAFEAIFSIPEKDQRKHFKLEIEKISKLDGEKTYINYWGKKTNPKSKELLSKKGIWAEKFYLLRNAIVHGDLIKPTDFIFEKTQEHIHIALLFFVLAVKKQFEKSHRGFYCNYEIRWEEHTDDISFPEPRTIKLFVFHYSMRRLWNKMIRRPSKKKV